MQIEKEAFAKIRRLHIEALREVDDFFAGSYRSLFKGQGMEFEEVRDYQNGDDVRTIDWNVSARSQKLFVKHFREERELTLILVVDISASTDFSHTKKQKRELIAEIAALLAFSAIKNQDKVGLLLFSSEIELYLRPKKGGRHVLRLIRELLYFRPKSKGTDLQKALRFLGNVQSKQAICFLISDFLTPGFEQSAKILAQKHELIAAQVFDTYERHFEPEGLFEIRDLETAAEQIIDMKSPKAREHYQHQKEKEHASLKHLFGKLNIDFFSLNTSESSADALHRFFNERKRKK